MGANTSANFASWRMARRSIPHVPVMLKEVVELLRPEDGKTFIDMTFGAGGHTRGLLETNKSIRVIAVDRDPVAFSLAQKLAAEVAIKSERLSIKQSVIPIHGKFSSVMRDIHLNGVSYGSVHGVLFDLGSSSMQYDDKERGFSLSGDGPLDMRMDTSNDSDVTAEDVVNNLNEQELAIIFKTLGEDRRSRKIANAIIDARTLIGRIKTTHELARIIDSSAPASMDALNRYSHPGTKVFQALRIFVNNELNELNYAIDKIREFLISAPKEATDKLDDQALLEQPAGRAVVLTFHSLEDRIVKRHFTGVDINEPVIRRLSQHDRIRTNTLASKEELENMDKFKKWMPILKHVKKPSDEETSVNPRSRSAKLRAAIRVD